MHVYIIHDICTALELEKNKIRLLHVIHVSIDFPMEYLAQIAVFNYFQKLNSGLLERILIGSMILIRNNQYSNTCFWS